MSPSEEHAAKYDALADVLGFDALAALVPVPVERVRAALAAGDVHLNSIPLHRWDRAALGAPQPRPCPTCGRPVDTPKHFDEWRHHDPLWPQEALRGSAHLEPWRRQPTLSLAGRVCALKRVAVRLAELTST